MLGLKKKGQTALEYLVLFTIILAAFLSGGVYFKRGLQGRWKSAVDDMGDQYDPLSANSYVVHRMNSNTETDILAINTEAGQWTSRTDQTNMIETKGGYISSGGY